MEIYKKWVPVQDIVAELLVKEIHADDEGLQITLATNEPTSKILRLIFPRYLLFRSSDESGRIKLWAEAKFEDIKWQFCVTTSSRLTEWLFEESDGIYEKEIMVHYLIKTGTDVIDIITDQTLPQVHWE